ncbi:MAG: hypothetical protein AB1898_03320 [Acidobacteriota bacterium]
MQPLVRSIRWIAIALLVGWVDQAQALQSAPAGRERQVIRLKGKVTNVEVAFGRGPGRFTLDMEDGEKEEIRLAPARYLVQKGFNLRAGDRIEVEVAKVLGPDDSTAMVALKIKNLTTDQTLRLRDDQMRPVWRGRGRGRGRDR